MSEYFPQPTQRALRWTLAALCAAALLSGCGVNPVTGKQELQFVSEAAELQIGEQQYAPSRHSQGGDLRPFPGVNAYVSEVGQKLAAVSDRALPYEFVVLNSSVPNAWALPGGKIAVNRGLLTALKSEAELAAVLGHEIVHSSARQGAGARHPAADGRAGSGRGRPGGVATQPFQVHRQRRAARCAGHAGRSPRESRASRGPQCGVSSTAAG